ACARAVRLADREQAGVGGRSRSNAARLATYRARHQDPRRPWQAWRARGGDGSISRTEFRCANSATIATCPVKWRRALRAPPPASTPVNHNAAYPNLRTRRPRAQARGGRRRQQKPPPHPPPRLDRTTDRNDEPVSARESVIDAPG